MANICRLVTVGDNTYIYNNDSVLAVCLQPGGVEDKITFLSRGGVLGAGAIDKKWILR